jgi:hypothetical protein
MNEHRNRSMPALRRLWHPILVATLLAASAQAQVCVAASEMEASARTAVEAAARRYFDMVARGDSAGIQQNAIPGVGSNFAPIEAAIKDNQPLLAGTQPVLRPLWELQVAGTDAIERAEFLCGVFGTHGQTAGSAVFVIPNLPPGNYAVATFDVSTAKGPFTVSFVLQQAGNDWKVGGFYAKATQIAGHDGQWFADRAREFKTKGQMRNAWLYFVQARDLSSPLPFMSTSVTDKLYDEMQTVQPTDLPVSGAPVDLSAGAKTYKLTSVFPVAFGEELDLVVKYQAADVSNTGQTYRDNVALIKAVVAKFPEFRAAFTGIVARAVEPSGRDYGSLLPMKDVR